MNLDAATRFIRTHGTAAERLRLDALLGPSVAPEAAIAAVAADQRGDGGWAPFWAPESGLDATCFRLAQIEAVALGRIPEPMRRAVAFLADRQRPDGSWEEDARYAASAPPWCRPGDSRAGLYVSANCAYWLARLQPEAETSARGAAYLAASLGPSGRLPSFAHAQWLAAGALWAVGRPEAGGLVATLGEALERLSAGGLAWLLMALRGAGVPAAHPVLSEARARLREAQEDDGRWASDDGPEGDVHATLEAIRALTS
jgi:hypothetical protein